MIDNADYLVRLFKEHKLLDEDINPSVKLHMTLLNTRFRFVYERQRTYLLRRGDEATEASKERETFDAREILSMYGSVVLEEKLKIESLHLSQRGSYGPDGYYTCVHKWTLP